MKKTDKQKILAFLAHHHLTVIATTDLKNRYPESALIAFTYNDKLELFFQTNKYSRKAVNLRKNPGVAFVIGLGLTELGTIQYQGKAEQLESQEEIDKCKQSFIARKSPTAKPEYLEHPDAIYFKVTPVWLAYIDYRQPKADVIEEWFKK
jgi:general stress protein 26